MGGVCAGNPTRGEHGTPGGGRSSRGGIPADRAGRAGLRAAAAAGHRVPAGPVHSPPRGRRLPGRRGLAQPLTRRYVDPHVEDAPRIPDPEGRRRALVAACGDLRDVRRRGFPQPLRPARRSVARPCRRSPERWPVRSRSVHSVRPWRYEHVGREPCRCRSCAGGPRCPRSPSARFPARRGRCRLPGSTQGSSGRLSQSESQELADRIPKANPPTGS